MIKKTGLKAIFIDAQADTVSLIFDEDMAKFLASDGKQETEDPAIKELLTGGTTSEVILAGIDHLLNNPQWSEAELKTIMNLPLNKFCGFLRGDGLDVEEQELPFLRIGAAKIEVLKHPEKYHCPICHAPLQLIDGHLKCVSCPFDYDIDDLPDYL